MQGLGQNGRGDGGITTAATIAALTIYDMCKAVDRGMEINGVTLLHKEGGKSGDWHRETVEPR